MKKQFFRICSMILALVLLVNMLPLQIFAEEYQRNLIAEQTEESAVIPDAATDASSAEISTEDAYVVVEITENRTEYSKEFLMSNGLHMAAVYADPVHYETENGWEEIDNTLKTNTDGSYSNTAGIWDVTFPEQLGEDESVTIEKDGYTLSFSMSGELTGSGAAAMSAGLDDAPLQTFGITEAQTAIGEIQNTEETETAEYPEAIPEKLQSQIAYAEVYENTDIVYDLASNTVKESMILESYDPDLQGYSYALNVGAMLPVLGEDGSVTLYDEDRKDIVMVMPAPYLIDGSGAHSYDIEVLLEGSGSTYTLLYLLPTDWLAEDDRTWPVVLDPLVQGNTAATNIQDRTVAQDTTYAQNGSILEVGYTQGTGIHRAYLKYDTLPPITSSDVVVYATMSLYKPEDSNVEVIVEAHKVTENWTSAGITWADQPAWNSAVEDYLAVKDAGYYHWEITDLVRDWYASANNGMMFKADATAEASTTDNYKQFTSSDLGTTGTKPVLSVFFRNNNGLESYWDYTASSAGRAGTGYVNNYTGNLVWVREDMGFGGNRMPVAISHIYNLNDSANNTFGLGNGWRTNYNQLVYKWDGNSNYYIWEDADGTKHYFKYESTNTYKDEDGLELTLTDSGSGNKKYCITDKNGNCSYFDAQGRLYQLTNNQATKSSITLTYTTTDGYKISTIRDGINRQYVFDYASTQLQTINYYGTDGEVVADMHFGYSGNLLETITDMDGKSSSFQYNGNRLITASDIDGYKLTYTHTRGTSGTWQPYRVSSVKEQDGSALGGKLTFAYAHNETTVTDYHGNVQVYQFNDFGNTVSIQDDQGRARFTQFARTKKDDTAGKANQLKVSSKLQNTIGNYLENSGFESTVAWNVNSSALTVSRSTQEKYCGSASLKLVSTATSRYGTYSPVFYAKPGETLTFSAYVKNPDGKAVLALHHNDGVTYQTYYAEDLPVSNDWVRSEVTFTNTTDGALRMCAYLFAYSAGTYYMDCVQVEKAASASRYNLMANGDLRFNTTWQANGNAARATNTAASPTLDSNVYKITGTPQQAQNAYESIPVSGNAGDTYVLAGWAKGDSVPLNSPDDASQKRSFCLKAVFYNTNGTTTERVVSFNPDCPNSWQYAASAVVAEKDYSSIRVYVCYDYNANTAYFDGIQLYKEEFGSSYTYDNNGNVISVKDLQGLNTTYEYKNNKLTEIIENGVSKMTYEYYENSHNIKTATTSKGVCYSFEYDAYGNNTKVSTTTDGKTMSSRATYTSNGNYLAITTDALGKVTTYQYNTNTGVLEWVQYPEDTSQTRTEYTYDNMYRTASAACTTNTGLGLSANYTYTDDLLTKIQTPTTAYNFTYGAFDLRTGVSVGSQSLATYTYSTDRKYNLQTLDYGNGDSVQYTYDDQDRVIKQTYENGDYISYFYNNDGDLAKVYDSQTGITTTYTYDLSGRLVEYRETGDGHDYSLSYTYDKENQITNVMEIVNGHDRESTYRYNTDGQITFFEKVLARRQYSYDNFGRLESTETLGQGMDTIYDTTYTYNDTTSTVSGQVASVKHISTYGEKHPYEKTYSYTYDDNGNILSVNDGTYTTTYTYDSANQLIRENNRAGNFTHTWTYDAAGNILTRNEYAYTTGELGEPTDTVTYTYGDSQWGDLLTAYDGNTITYDGIGNPLTDGTWTYTWQHGRQLASMTDGTTTWDYTYDANGLRTERTDGTTNYRYVYEGDKLTFMARNGLYLRFAYTPEGTPLSVLYKGTTYYYVTNLQGDVVAILTGKGYVAVEYTYDARGNLLSTSGPLANSLGQYNPLRYRGYVYDVEIGLYYNMFIPLKQFGGHSMKRKDYISWDEYFMGVAKLAARRSKDPSTQVGACIVSPEDIIISTGYNGMPKGCSDDEFPWDREGEETKYPYVVHAELNAILNANGRDLRGSRVYVALFPCNECAKAIIQSGVKEVIYLSDKYANTPGTLASKRMLAAAGVKCTQLRATTKSITIDLTPEEEK